jgi:nucleoside-diphosphate-sugar epimerase
VVDVARAFMLLIEKYPVSDPVNIGTDEQTSIKELVYRLLKLNGQEGLSVIFDTTKPEGRKHKGVDVLKLKRLGFEPIMKLEKGLSEVVESYRGFLRNLEIPTLMEPPEFIAEEGSLKKG